VLVRFPRMSSYNLDNIIRPRVEFLRERLAPLSAEQLRAMMCLAPGMLAVKLEERFDLLESELGLSSEALRRCVLGYPNLLRLSVKDTLVPKVAFFEQVTGSTRDEVLNACMKAPVLLGYSLEKRLKPRCEVMKSAGVAPSLRRLKVNGCLEDWKLRVQEKKKTAIAVVKKPGSQIPH